MTAIRAILSFLHGVERHGQRVREALPGTPAVLRLTYVKGHPGIWHGGAVWLGRVGDRLRLVEPNGTRWHDLPLDRIRGISYEWEGRLCIRYEPTAGLVTTVEFRAEEGAGADCYQRLASLVAAIA